MSSLVEMIDAAFTGNPEAPRAYIGASIAGTSCDAVLAFNLRGYPGVELPPNVMRIFRDGHRIEEIIVADLKNAGLHIEEVDPRTGKQWEWKACGGHLVGHADGIIWWMGEVHILEAKSMNENQFHLYQRLGVKDSHPSYYRQCQVLMGLSGITQTVFIAYNKNRSTYHAEIIEADPFQYAFLVSRVERVLEGDARKIAKDETDWRCRNCFKRGACWNGLEPEKTVKTCANAQPIDGGWSCAKGCTTTCEDWQRYEPLPKE